MNIKPYIYDNCLCNRKPIATFNSVKEMKETYPNMKFKKIAKGAYIQQR